MPTPAADAQALPTPRLSHLVDVTAALAAHAEQHDRTADLPHAGLAVVHEAGLLTLTVERTWDHLGLRASRSDDVIFDRVPVPFGATLDLAEPGPPGADPGGLRAWNALGIAAIYLGVATAARDWLTGYLRERVPTNLGQPLASLPRFQSEVGVISARLFTATTLVEAVALAVDRGEQAGSAQPGIAKTVATTAAIEAVQRAVALIGNAGLSRRNPLERHLRDVLCGRVHTPQDDVVLTSAGRAQLERNPL